MLRTACFMLCLLGFSHIALAESTAPAMPNITTVALLEHACKQVELAEDGKEINEAAYGLCFGYIRGVKNSYDVQQKNGVKGKICTPPNATWRQLIVSFLRWAKRTPQQHSALAWVGLINAWAADYPCME